MAQSPTHKFGQIIGNLVEDAIEPFLQEIADENDVYLDREGTRPARRGKKVKWKDKFGNNHDLDYVMEEDGTDEERGKPCAFIEAAWRRYTKHSRNKAQEIQGAVRPLAETHSEMAPFLGAVVSGVFTNGSLDQLRSLGFSVLYFEYETIVNAFEEVGVNAYWEQGTDNEKVKKEVDKWEKLQQSDKQKIRNSLVEQNSEKIEKFRRELNQSLERRITRVSVIPLHGEKIKLDSISDAINFIENYDGECGDSDLIRFEIIIEYSNGDEIDSKFQERKDAIKFLNYYL